MIKIDDSIVFKTQERYLQFQFSKILYCKSVGNYTDFYIEDCKINNRVCVTLKQIENTIGGMGFLRIHQSFLVNQNKITSFCSKFNTLNIQGENLPISKNKRTEVIQSLLKNKIPDTKKSGQLLK